MFFFFKQKTAYEMRISDWSSDVCSSDLLDQHRVHAGDFGRGAERAVVHVASGASGDLRYLARRQGAWRAAVELAQRRKGDVAHVHVEEIGRASCRERGCQYV